MLVEDVTGILEENKRYMSQHTGTVHTGKTWLKIFDRSPYEHIYASDVRSLIEVEKDKNTKNWIKVK